MSEGPDQKNEKTTGWVMPEPVFRSSEGRAPGKTSFEDSQQDIPTEPGFRDADDDVVAPPSPRRTEETPKPSRAAGCARTMLSLVGIVHDLRLPKAKALERERVRV